MNEEVVYKAKPWLEIVKQTLKIPNNNKIIDDYYQVKQPSYVEIAVLDEDDNVLICKRYKHGVREETLGFPGGYIEKNENPLNAAKRELHEECSLKAQIWENLGAFVIDGNRSLAKAHLFCAKQLLKTYDIESDDIEETKFIWYKKDKLKSLVLNKKIKTLGAATLALMI